MEQIIATSLKALSVMATGCLYFWAGIPAGLAFKFSVVVSALLSAAGACVGVVALGLAGAPVQRWFIRKFEKQFEKFKKTRLMRVWDKFGVAGFCFISPCLTGAPQAVLIALILGAKPKPVILWTCTGVLTFTAVLIPVFLVGAENIPFLKRWISG
jgi:hypothetical protein